VPVLRYLSHPEVACDPACAASPGRGGAWVSGGAGGAAGRVIGLSGLVAASGRGHLATLRLGYQIGFIRVNCGRKCGAARGFVSQHATIAGCALKDR